jgi:hypothetical protein
MKICSKHGKIGDPSCKECWEALKHLTESKNVYVSGENALKGRIIVPKGNKSSPGGKYGN